jgi:outer membrane protein assembly factor BamA
MWDGRDNLFYPTSGIFAKRTGEFAIDNLLSTNAFYRTTIDLRLYRKVIENHIFAAQMCFQGIWGSRLPFQQLTTFGGSDVMRGFRRGMFRDNASIALQTEYRLPVYKRLKAGIFVSAGDVLGKHYEKSQLKFAYGAGLRYRLNAAGVHLRADAAKNNYGDPWQFYLTVGEAF